MTSWMIEIPIPCRADGKPLEPVTGNRRVHHMVRARIHRTIREQMAVVMRSERNWLGAPAARALRTIEPTIIRGPGRQFLDPDNAVSYCKPAVDALVDSGWLVGDKPHQVDYRMPRQERGPRAAVRFKITADE